MSYIEIKNVTKSYDGKELILKNLDLNMEEGSLNTLLGPSGSGKSTLLRCIAGLEEINSGEVYINGKRVDQLPPRNRNLGMVFQQYALFPNMNVLDNVKFGLEMKKVDKKLQEEQALEMIRLVGLEDRKEAYPRQLSGGQQQRVALARSLVTRPDVLLLDEPLSALDAKIRMQLRELIKDIQNELGITVILVTHDQEEAMTMSDYIFVMESGNIVQRGTPSEVYRRPENRFVANFIGNHNVFEVEDFHDFSDYALGPASLVAIRPETLSFEPLEDAIQIHGKIQRTSMLGSILRFNVLVGDQIIKVDQLNRSKNFREDGEPVDLYLSKDDLIVVR
ncbi:ABC transporter ATP-binding protein [Aerococcus sanguinicola]|uniref:ABC-type quaternary amine transporter n=1 Tax=Aerococcus sanguinicola TaxID=119206 RepID=A0A2I1MQ59_9LACT|nr:MULTISPECIES: ABC transporter ATP-binding protein [Aerococcus]MDK7050130.1 ABC transporter ATP-binding protein [Aerococcus sanguinicola]OFT93329.1 ABC transporter ATP-binding protein [Aerococcus sp. HMSC23C02]PKZ22266.1 ABC transporter ATP-binding protein [Aerococcus sanguinicola]